MSIFDEDASGHLHAWAQSFGNFRFDRKQPFAVPLKRWDREVRNSPNPAFQVEKSTESAPGLGRVKTLKGEPGGVSPREKHSAMPF